MSGVIREGDISDHSTIFILIKFQTDGSSLIKRFRDHNEECILKLRNEVSLFIENTYHNMSIHMDVHTKCKYLIQHVYNIYDKCCSIRSKQVSFKSLKNPWIDYVLADAVKEKFRLFRDYKRGVVTFNYYNVFKNNLQTRIRRAKKNYFD